MYVTSTTALKFNSVVVIFHLQVGVRHHNVFHEGMNSVIEVLCDSQNIISYHLVSIILACKLIYWHGFSCFIRDQHFVGNVNLVSLFKWPNTLIGDFKVTLIKDRCKIFLPSPIRAAQCEEEMKGA